MTMLKLAAALAVLYVLGAMVMAVSRPEAAGPSHELQVGQTYEVMWGCNAQGCAVEILTIAHVDKKSGWAQDTNGYWFHEHNLMAYRVAQRVPVGHPATPTPGTQIKAEGQ